VEPRAQQRLYSLAPAAFDDLDAWLQGYRRDAAVRSDPPAASASMPAEADADPTDPRAASRPSAGRSTSAKPAKSPKPHKKSAKSKAGKLRKPAKSGGSRKS